MGQRGGITSTANAEFVRCRLRPVCLMCASLPHTVSLSRVAGASDRPGQQASRQQMGLVGGSRAGDT